MCDPVEVRPALFGAGDPVAVRTRQILVILEESFAGMSVAAVGQGELPIRAQKVRILGGAGVWPIDQHD
jgi:hypothetical protein